MSTHLSHLKSELQLKSKKNEMMMTIMMTILLPPFHASSASPAVMMLVMTTHPLRHQRCLTPHSKYIVWMMMVQGPHKAFRPGKHARLVTSGLGTVAGRKSLPLSGCSWEPTATARSHSQPGTEHICPQKGFCLIVAQVLTYSGAAHGR